MTAVVFALSSALVYGIADFLGGLASRRSEMAMPVVWLSQATGLALLVAVVGFLPATGFAPADLVWGAGAGAAGGFALISFYRGLAEGRMSVVAPLAAVITGGIPVLVGLGLGERPGLLAFAGIAVALVAIALISREPPTAEIRAGRSRAVLLAVLAGIGFGAFFVLLERSGDDTGLWPLLAARTTSVTMIGVVLLPRRGRRLPTRTSLRATIGAGVLDVSANVLYLLAVRRGLLTLVSVLIALYPASTVVLAQVVLGERLRRVQGIGLGVGAVAVALISVA
ncbi:DMT family transporter [soil metagenome]